MKRILHTPWLIYLLILLVSLNMVITAVFGYHYVLKRTNKIAYVDAIELMRNYHGMIKVKKQLDEEALVWKANLDTLKREADLEIQKYEIQKPGLSVKKRVTREQKIEEMKKKYFDYKNVVDTQYHAREKELLEKMLSILNAKIKVYARENGYDIILSSGSQSSIAYANDYLNLTKDLIELLNKDYKENNK